MADDVRTLRKKVDFLEVRISLLENQLSRALELAVRDPGDPESTVVKSRVILEKVTKELYAKLGMELPKKAIELGGMINNNQFTNQLPARIVLRMNSVREYSNLGAHDKGPVTASDALDCLNCLVEILTWYCEEHLGGGVQYPRERRGTAGSSASLPGRFAKRPWVITAVTGIALIATSVAFLLARRLATTPTPEPIRLQTLIAPNATPGPRDTPVPQATAPQHKAPRETAKAQLAKVRALEKRIPATSLSPNTRE